MPDAIAISPEDGDLHPLGLYDVCGKEEQLSMTAHTKIDPQIEWVWEFFLKNCNDTRMIQELLKGLPFPEENLDLKQMLFLRALSVQASAESIDEHTLDLFRGIIELSKVTGARRERLPTHFSRQEAPERRKLSEDESNDDEVAASAEETISASSGKNDGRATSAWNSDQRRESSEDVRKVEAVVGIKDWMKGRALPRSMGGPGPSEEQKGCNLNYEAINAVNAGTPLQAGDSPKGGEHTFRPSQFAKQWELELAIMLELAVKHLRGDTPDRKSFEYAVTKHWGEPSWDDTNGCGPDSVDVATVREQIKRELSMVRKNPELLDGVVEKFTKARVEDMLKTYLEKAWVAIGQTFLERVSADVINGKYKPVNCNGQRGKKAGSPLMDGEVGHQSNGKLDTSEKPWIRASGRRYSRSLEKLQKNFAIGELDDDNEGGSTAKLPADERNREDEEARAEQQAGKGPIRLDRQEDTANLKEIILEGGEVRPTLSTEGGLVMNVRSQNFDVVVKNGAVVRVLDFDEHSGHEIEDGIQEKQDCVTADIEAIEAQDVVHQADGAGALPCRGDDVDGSVCVPVNRVPDIGEVSREVPDAINLSEEKETSIADDKKWPKQAISPTNKDWLGPEPGFHHKVVNKENVVPPSSPKPMDHNPTNADWPVPGPHEVVNKENVVPPSSPKPMDSNPTVCFSPPPWEAPPAVLVAEGIASGLTRKRTFESVQEESVTEFRKEDSKIAEASASTDGSNQSPGSTTTQRNLRMKQRALDGVVEDPLPTILTTRSKGSLLERNTTARTVEWDDDEIEESPPSSPSASRYVLLRPTAGKTISPLTSSKTSGTVNSKQGRRKPRRWSEKEVEILKREVGKYGKGRWKMILGKNLDDFQGRTEVDLKDKWRNLERFEGITD